MYIEIYIKSDLSKIIKQKNIIVDPGISFGKSGDDNIKILKNMSRLVSVFKRVCIGVSNKRFSSKVFNEIKDDEMSIASLAVSTLAAYNGIEFLRVHDIDENQDAVDVAWKTINS